MEGHRVYALRKIKILNQSVLCDHPGIKNFVVIIATMAAFWHRASTTPKEERQGKFMGFSSSDDMLSDVFDEISDPFPVHSNSISVKQYVLQKLKKKGTVKKDPEPMPPLPIPELIVQKLTTPSPPVYYEIPTTKPVYYEMPTKKPVYYEMPTTNRPVVNHKEPLILYDSGNSKFEVTPAGFASHPQPITEGMFLIGGHIGHTEASPNMTEENIRIFWSSLGDFIESVPFLPIQVNVPDLISAMASFFSQRLPFLNRVQNPTQPRPNAKVPQVPVLYEPYLPDLPAETNLLEYRHINEPTPVKPKKKTKKNSKKKRNKRRSTSTTESYNIRGVFSTTTAKPKKATAKAWFQKPTEASMAKTTQQSLKLFHHNNSPDAETLHYKNMPIVRTVNRFKDKEMFNFRNSDISNSPIMIVNMPNRHVLFYKLHHEQKTEVPDYAPSNKYRL